MTAPSAEVFGHRFVVQLPPKVGPDGKKNALEELTPADAERVAIGISSILREWDIKHGRPPRKNLRSDWVEISKEPEAGTYSVTVVDRDVMAAVLPYVDPKPGDVNWPPSFHKPMLFGRRLDGRRHYRRIDEHGQLIGMSTGGKSSFIQDMIAYDSLCAERNRDVVVWIAGEHKLYDLVMGWIEPYLNSGRRSPIDWIVKGYDDALQMMAAVRRVAQFRQSARMNERGNWPWIHLILDEVSSLVEHHKQPIMFDGEWQHADTLAADIVRYDSQGDVAATLAMQHDVHAVLGDKGNTLQAQMKYSMMFQINDDSSHGRQLGNYKLKMPTHAGEYWILDQELGIPIRLKAPYPQSSDPRKEKLHDGLTVADIALSRNMPADYGLDPASAAVAGDRYLSRPKYVDEAFIDYLRGIRPVTAINGAPAAETPPARIEPPEQRAVSDAEDELAMSLLRLRELGEEIPEEMVDFLSDYEARLPIPAVAAQVQPAGEVSSLVGRLSRKDRVRGIIADQGPIGRAAIVARLHGQGDRAATPQQVTNILTELVSTGEYVRDAESQYSLAR